VPSASSVNLIQSADWKRICLKQTVRKSKGRVEMGNLFCPTHHPTPLSLARDLQ
jgi:hypothetical protein